MPTGCGIEDGDVGGTARLERATRLQRAANHLRGRRTEQRNYLRKTHSAFVMQLSQAEPEGGLQSSNAHRGALELLFLFVDRMRSMIGGNAIDAAVKQTGNHRLAIDIGTQRRIHFVVRIVLTDIFVEQQEVM